MSQALSRITHPTPSWVSYCGKFRVISNDDSSTDFLVQSFKDTAWTTFSQHSDWQSIKRKYGDTYTFSNLPDKIVQLPETHPDYPTVYADDRHRVIVCADLLQYILQRRKGRQWHNQSYLTEWEPLCRHNPHLPLPTTSPMLLSHEIARYRRSKGYEGKF